MRPVQHRGGPSPLTARIADLTIAIVPRKMSATSAAAAGADWKKASDFRVLVTDMPGEQAYPIAMTVFVFMPKTGSRTRTRAVLDFFRWSLENGAGVATELGYVPLPRPLVRQVLEHWTTRLKAAT